MSFKSIALFLVFSFCILKPSFAQEDEWIDIRSSGYRFLDYSQALPKQLLSGRSAVFVSVPPINSTSSIKDNWKELAVEAHTSFKESGIDAMAYFNMNDLYASSQVSKDYAKWLKTRQVDFIIILIHNAFKIGKKETERYVVVIVPFNGRETFFDHGAKTFKDQHKKLDKLLKNLNNKTLKSNLERTNNLITDKPEFFYPRSIHVKRYERYNPNLGSDKLAIPRFSKIEIPENIPRGVVNKNLVKQAEKLNVEIDQWNKQLERLMKRYPFKYEIVNYNWENEEQMRKKGFDFVLMNIHTSGKSVKSFLGYQMEDDDDSYVTLINKNGKNILRNIPAEALVYKYYIKHIYSGDIYLGPRWDADEQWQDALNHSLDNLIKTVK